MISQEAIDIIESYGADNKRWPALQRSAVLAAIKSDSTVAEALKTQKELDDQLANWEVSEDGSSVNDEDEDQAGSSDKDIVPGDDDSEEPDDGDEGDGEDEPEPEDERKDETDSEEMADLPGGVGDNRTDVDLKVGEEPELEKEPPLDIILSEEDLGELKDAEDMIGDFISKVAVENADDWFVFTRDHDDMETIKARGHSTEALDRAIAASTGALQKNLQRLILARTRSRMTPGFRSGKLHGASLHRLMSGDDRLFRRKEEAKSLDTAITLLIDCSGSMTAKIHRGSMKSRIALAIESAYAMATVLSKIGVDFEVIGFTTKDGIHFDTKADAAQYEKELDDLVNKGVTVHRYYPLHMPVFKAFGEPWNVAVAKRFATAHADSRPTVGLQSNTDGESLRIAAERLHRVKAERRIMIVFSDGEPACAMPRYAKGEKGDYNFADKDLVKSVKQVQKSGVEVVAIGMAHAGVREFYDRAEVVHDLASMPVVLMKQLKDLLV
jgi:cobalamin biosynthesis protein CobT